MKLLFSQNYKYMLKNFEYLDITDFARINKPRNLESLSDILDYKKYMVSLISKHLPYIINLKQFYINKRL